MEREGTLVSKERLQQLKLLDKIGVHLEWFKRCMYHELKANLHKGFWGGCSLEFLLKRCNDEHYEMMQALLQFKFDEVIRECADEANFRLMIANLCRTQPERLTKEINAMQNLRSQYGL